MRVITANGPGIGDAMALSLLVEELGRRGEKCEVSTSHPELFAHNPHVSLASPWAGTSGRSFPELDDMRSLGRKSMYAHMLERMGISPVGIDIRQRFYFGCDERERLSQARGVYVTIHPVAGPWTRNKDWQWSDWELLVQGISNRVPVFQVGARNDRPVGGANHTYMGCDLRTTARLIRDARVHLCVVSGTMHIASAVGAPTLVIFGGREHPEVTGYPAHVRLHAEPAEGCAPCWLVEPCPYLHSHLGDKPCMTAIRATDVLQVAHQMLP